MDAVQFTEHGDADVIEYGEYGTIEPGPEEVRFNVLAGAVSHLDVWTRQGLPGLDLEMPHIPGGEAAGVVEAVGERVSRFETGDKVTVTPGIHCGTCEFCRAGDPTMCTELHLVGQHTRGVHAETAVVHEDNLVAVPAGVDPMTAAAAPLVFQTAWRMLVTRAGVKPGESVLVLGAAGGVGHAAVQVAAFVGADVYAAASTEEKLRFTEDLGAHYTIDYASDHLPEEIRALTNGRGVDVVVDHVGADTWSASLECLANGGRLVTCGATTGGAPETDVTRIFWNQLEIIGSTLGTPGEIDDVLELVWDGVFYPHVDDVLPMSETSTAHEWLQSRDVFGKVVLQPDRTYEKRRSGRSGAAKPSGPPRPRDPDQPPRDADVPPRDSRDSDIPPRDTDAPPRESDPQQTTGQPSSGLPRESSGQSPRGKDRGDESPHPDAPGEPSTRRRAAPDRPRGQRVDVEESTEQADVDETEGGSPDTVTEGEVSGRADGEDDDREPETDVGDESTEEVEEDTSMDGSTADEPDTHDREEDASKQGGDSWETAEVDVTDEVAEDVDEGPDDPDSTDETTGADRETDDSGENGEDEREMDDDGTNNDETNNDEPTSDDTYTGPDS